MTDTSRAAGRWPLLVARSDALRRALGRLGQDADDAAQEALVRAAAWPGEMPSGPRLGAWLSTIARRAAIDEWRRRARVDALDEVHAAAAQLPAGTLDIDAALSRLSAADRRLLRSVAAGFTYEEIASSSGASVTAIRQRVARARARLLHHLGGKR